MSTKKAVVFNMGSAIIPSMNPIMNKNAYENDLSAEELKSKLFVEGDQDLMAKVEPFLLDRHGHSDASIGVLMSAIKSIKAEGLKIGLVLGETGGMKPELIVDMDLFDVVTPELADSDMIKGVAPSEVVYVDTNEANLTAAAGLGLATVNIPRDLDNIYDDVYDIEKGLFELESLLQVPLKEWIPGVFWTFYESKNSPYTGKETLVYWLWCLLLYCFVGSILLKEVCGQKGGVRDPRHPLER